MESVSAQIVRNNRESRIGKRLSVQARHNESCEAWTITAEPGVSAVCNLWSSRQKEDVAPL
jgi:hypothetical protein